MKSFLSLLLLITLAGCGTLNKKAGNRLQMESRWTRNTYRTNFLEFRRLHKFSPILTETLIIQANGVDGVRAYDRVTGNQKWSILIKDGVESSAQLVGPYLFFGASDGYFYAVDIEEGQVKWTFPIRSEGLGTPLVHKGIVYFLAGNNVAYALEADSGKQLWLYSRRDSSILSVRGGSQPVLYNNSVIFGFSDGSLVALNKDSGGVLWDISLNKNKRFRDVDAQVVLEEERLYVPSYDGALYSLKAGSGEIIWSLDQGGESAVTIVKDRLYFSSSDGQVHAVDKNSGKIIWSRKNKYGISTQPVIYRGLVLVGEYGGDLLALNSLDGSEIQKFVPGRGVTSRPSIDESRNELYFMSADANLFALRLAWRKSTDLWPWEDSQ